MFGPLPISNGALGHLRGTSVQIIQHLPDNRANNQLTGHAVVFLVGQNAAGGDAS